MFSNTHTHTHTHTHTQDPSAKIGKGCRIGPNVIIGPDVVIEDGRSAVCQMLQLLTLFLSCTYIRCVHVNDDSSPGIKGQISCVGTEEYYWLGLNCWKMGMTNMNHVTFIETCNPGI